MNQIKRQVRRTVQSQYRDEREVGIGVLFNMAIAGELMPPWWSHQRDVELTRFALRSDHFQGANWMISAKLCNVPFRVEARDRTVKRHQKIANEYQAILENVTQIGQGWGDFWSRFYADLWTTDNGAFGEILGMGSPGAARKGPAMGLLHMDSLQCTRTSNPEYPVIYQDVGGKRYRMHHTRVIYKSQRPSARADKNGVGHSWLTRAINNVQQLVDQDVYFQEALGSRPMRQMMLGKGIDPDDMIAAVKRGEEGMDNQGLSRYAKTVFVGDRNRVDIGIDTIPFTFLPDGYDKQQQTSIAMFVIALAGGFPPRWLWPATQAGATKADAMFQHISGSGGGALWHLNMMRDLLSYTDRALSIGAALPPKFLPKELSLNFDYKDDEEDRQQAEIQAVRAETRKVDIETGVVTVRVAREQALHSDDLTEAQFNQMELEDGRLPDGADVLTLFDSLDPLLIEMLDLGVDEPLLIDDNDPIEMMIAIEAAALTAQARMVQARSAGERAKAQQAIEALKKLGVKYGSDESPDGDQAPEEAEITPPTESEDTQEPASETDDDEPPDGEEEKAADEPPRGDFEQEIIRKLKPVFRKAQVRTLDALQRGVEPDDDELRKELIALFVPILTSAALYKVNLFEDQFTIAFEAGETQAEAERWARAHAAAMVAGLIITTQNVVGGIESDATQDEIEATVDRAFDENRREQIGITETTVALMWGALMYQRLMAGRGVQIELIWYTQNDELVCEICGPLHGTKQEVWSQEFPGGPPAHVRCRCDVIATKKR